MHTDDAKPKGLQSFAGDDGKRRGRRPSKVTSTAPFDLAADDKLMAGLDARGWYRELATRRRRAFVVAYYRPEDWPRMEREFAAGLKPIDDPQEMDRFMCRTEPVAKVETPLDLEVAQFNGRLVLEIDPYCLKKVLFRKIEDFLEAAREQKPKPKPSRHIPFAAWANHRLITLYDLQLKGYDLRRRRQQLAKWLFPEIDNPKARSDKFDRARKSLTKALTVLPTLLAWG
jgi:hypothetical protein